MDLNLISQYIQNRYSSVEFAGLSLGGLMWAADSERRLNAIAVDDFAWDVYRPPAAAPQFDTEPDCDCGFVLPPPASRAELSKPVVVVACLSEAQAKGLIAGRDSAVIAFDAGFKALLKSFIIALNKAIINELAASIGNNPLNTPVSSLPRIAQLWDFVDGKPDAMGAMEFKQELYQLGLNYYSIIAGSKFGFAANKNDIDFYLDLSISMLDGIVVDNYHAHGIVRPLLGLNSFPLRINGTSIGIKVTTNGCSDNDIRLTLGAWYGVFAAKELLNTGVYHYTLQ